MDELLKSVIAEIVEELKHTTGSYDAVINNWMTQIRETVEAATTEYNK